LTTRVAAPRARKSFSRLKHVLDLPNLIDIQKASFHWFLDEGLRETIDDISPIEDYTGTLAVEFGEYKFGDPPVGIQECREKDLTYQAPLSMTVRFVNKETGEIREQTVFMGDFPMMTQWGTFIINGTERVIVTQLVRSPGAYLMEPKDPAKQVFTANLMPSRGSWLELEIDKKGVVYARIDRKRKLPITTLLRALPEEDPSTGWQLDTSSNEAIMKLFGDSIYIANTLEKDPSTREDEALIEVFKKQRPGEPPTLDNARNLLRSLFFDPKRYDLTKVGRYKLNQRLGVDVPDDVRVLTTQDILALVKKLVELPDMLGVDPESKDYAADAIVLPRDPVRGELDEYEHFGNRRLRTVGELIQEAFRVGLYRMERVVRERMTTEDVDTITPQTIINIRPVVAEGVLRLLAAVAVHGPDELARRPDAPAPPVGARRRRPDPRARADRGARRPPDALRPHVPDRDAGGPEHRPDRLARVVRDRLRVRLRADAVPEGVQRQGVGRDRLPRRRRGGAVHDRPGERASGRQDRPLPR
jgi:DNA-directed RNA polymerase subunit beta